MSYTGRRRSRCRAVAHTQFVLCQSCLSWLWCKMSSCVTESVFCWLAWVSRPERVVQQMQDWNLIWLIQSKLSYLWNFSDCASRRPVLSVVSLSQTGCSYQFPREAVNTSNAMPNNVYVTVVQALNWLKIWSRSRTLCSSDTQVPVSIQSLCVNP